MIRCRIRSAVTLGCQVFFEILHDINFDYAADAYKQKFPETKSIEGRFCIV